MLVGTETEANLTHEHTEETKILLWATDRREERREEPVAKFAHKHRSFHWEAPELRDEEKTHAH